MLQVMGDNKRLLQYHEQKLSDLEAFKSDTQMFQKNASASLKNFETQVGQLTLNMPNQSKNLHAQFFRDKTEIVFYLRRPPPHLLF